MHCVRKIKEDIYWIGGNDRRLALFENIYPISKGVSYNSYLINDEKTVLVDTVDKSISDQFLENLEFALNGRTLDYIVVHHMEPDHCATVEKVVEKYPNVIVVGSSKTIEMIKQFFKFDVDKNAQIINEGDYITFGKHTLIFVSAPMVHWPEVMLSYDIADKILFSADAFGSFGALNGNIFNDEINFERDWLDDARRYYTNIVGKYGPQVMSVLKKASKLDIRMICPLHGPIWRENLGEIINHYVKWATYEPEEEGVVLAYASVYGNTENAINILACKLAEQGIKNIKVYDVSSTHPSVILAECFKYSHLVFASPTYNGGIFTKMHDLLLDLKAHNLQNRNVALIENGTWAPSSGKQMRDILSSMQNMRIVNDTITIKSSVKEDQIKNIENLATELLKMK